MPEVLSELASRRSSLPTHARTDPQPSPGETILRSRSATIRS